MKRSLEILLKYSQFILPILGICLACVGFIIDIYVPDQYGPKIWLTIAVILVINGFILGSMIKILYFSVYRDRLTGIGNRNLLYLRLKSKTNLNGSLAIIDIDNFKKVNDTYGHPAGDVVLYKLARILKQSIRSTDTLIRWGGEEFVIFFPHTNISRVMKLLERIRMSVETYDFGPRVDSKRITISTGISACQTERSSRNINLIDLMIDQADKALYAAKKTKNIVICYKKVS